MFNFKIFNYEINQSHIFVIPSKDVEDTKKLVADAMDLNNSNVFCVNIDGESTIFSVDYMRKSIVTFLKQ